MFAHSHVLIIAKDAIFNSNLPENTWNSTLFPQKLTLVKLNLEVVWPQKDYWPLRDNICIHEAYIIEHSMSDVLCVPIFFGILKII